MRYLIFLMFLVLTADIGTIVYESRLLNDTIKSAVPFAVFEAQYYEVNKVKKDGKDVITQIGAGPKVSRLQWSRGRLDFVDGGVPITDSARAFLIEAANTYNDAVKKQAEKK